MIKKLIVLTSCLLIYTCCNAQLSLASAIQEISSSYNVTFAYPTELLEDHLVKTKISDETLDEYLDLVFEDLPIEYHIFNSDKILLRRKTTIKSTRNNTQILSGIIKDEESNSALVSASLYLEDFKKGCYTDDKGNYTLIIDEADLNKTIIISYLGYEEKKISVEDLVNQSSVHLTLAENQFKPIIISHVTPTYLNKADGSYLIKNKLQSNNAGFSSTDLFRNIQMMSGISASNDDESSIKIRSSNSEQTLIILDEMPIYNSSHYYGVFSNINKNYIDEIHLYKNILPIEYAGFAAGMLKMKSNKMTAKNTGVIDFNLIAPSINIKLPIDSSFQIQIAARRSLLDLESIIPNQSMDQVFNFLSDNLQRKAITREKPSFNFYDLNGQIQYNLNNKTSIEANFFKSNDDFLLKYGNDFKRKKNGEENQIIERYEETRNWSNQAASIQYKTALSKSLLFRAIAYSSDYNHDNDVQSYFLNNDNNFEIVRNVELQNVIDEKGAKAIFNKTISRSNVQLGVEYNSFNVTQEISLNDSELVDFGNKAKRISLFSSYILEKNNWNINLGTRINRYTIKNESNYSLSPQASFRYKPADDLYLKASIGRNVQYLRMINYQRNDGNSVDLFRLANNSGIPPIYSNNYMIGLSKTFDHWNFDIEFYKKDLTGSIEYASRLLGFEGNSNNAPKIDAYKLYRGSTKIKGVDFGLSYASQKFNSFLSYTLSKADNYFSAIFKNNAFPNENDRRHELNWTNSFQLNHWIFSANYVFASGKPYLDLESLETLVDRENDNSDLLFKQLDYYSRFDLGIAYNIPLKKNIANVGFSVLNLLDRENVKYRQQTFSVAFDGNNQNDTRNAVIGSESSLLERTFNFSLVYAW